MFPLRNLFDYVDTFEKVLNQVNINLVLRFLGKSLVFFCFVEKLNLALAMNIAIEAGIVLK